MLYFIINTAVSGQECTGAKTFGDTDVTGFNKVPQGQTFILAGYAVPCSGTVVAWEFCYETNNATSVTFYPGIWRITGSNGGNTHYELVQSNSVRYDQSIQTSGANGCQRVNLSTTDQFTAPAASVVGLYSDIGTQLRDTNAGSTITTYQFSGNQSSVTGRNNDDVDYNIAIRVHIGKTMYSS